MIYIHIYTKIYTRDDKQWSSCQDDWLAWIKKKNKINKNKQTRHEFYKVFDANDIIAYLNFTFAPTYNEVYSLYYIDLSIH